METRSREGSSAMIRPLARRLLPLPVRNALFLGYQSFRISFQDFGANPPILIYQMGKVGSSAIQKSLEHSGLPNPIYHVHALSDAGIKADGEYYQDHLARVPREIALARILRRQIDKYRSKAHFKIITLVREPIGRQISDFFQNVEVYWPHLVDRYGKVKVDDAIEHLCRIFVSFDESSDYASTWFDRELKPMFGIDVYTDPFSHDHGFSVLREKTADVLILRFEDLDRCFEPAVREFFSLESHIPLLKVNVGNKKEYAEEYANVLENMVLPKSVCARIYSSKYAKHFYTESKRKEFIRKWSGEPDRASVDAVRSGLRSPEDPGCISGGPLHRSVVLE